VVTSVTELRPYQATDDGDGWDFVGEALEREEPAP
jgi:hypothetical protein